MSEIVILKFLRDTKLKSIFSKSIEIMLNASEKYKFLFLIFYKKYAFSFARYKNMD